MKSATGPLKGIKIVEIAGIGPGPFAGMMFSDMGADVLRIERSGGTGLSGIMVDERGRTKIELDLKEPAHIEKCLQLVEKADVIFEGFRPGVMERLGLGPEVVLQRNPRIVYGRMTGWGQDGPYANMAGHDMNYLAITGALYNIGPKEKPIPPLNLLADYGGGGMMLVVGVLAALLHARETGQGQVVDAAMSDGANLLMSVFHGMKASGHFKDGRTESILTGAWPFYDTYLCQDDQWICVGAVEAQFYYELIEKIGLTEFRDRPQLDPSTWRDLRPRLVELFRQKTRAEWCEILEGSDTCFAPVLTMEEAPSNTHMAHRRAFVEVDGIVQPAPAPRFSETPSGVQWGRTETRSDVDAAVAEWLGDYAKLDAEMPT